MKDYIYFIGNLRRIVRADQPREAVGYENKENLTSEVTERSRRAHNIQS